MILETVVGSRTKVRMISALLVRGYDSLSGLAADCGMSKKVVYEALLELEKTGVVKVERRSKSWKVSVNGTKMEVASLKKFFDMENSISVGRIVDALPKDEIKKIVWFGSTARGEATPTSDIDITVVSRLQKYETYRILENHVRKLEKIIRRKIHLEVVPKDSADKSPDFLMKGISVYG